MFGYQNKNFLMGNSWNIYLRQLSNFRALVLNNGADFIYFLQPMMGVCNKQLSEKEELMKNFFGSKYYTEKWGSYIGKARSFFESVSGRLKLSWQIDLSCMFKNEVRTVYNDPRHYNDLGQELIAKKVFESLKPRLK